MYIPDGKIAVVTYTDGKYLGKAKITIDEIRGNGKWQGDFVVMTDGLFTMDSEYVARQNLTIKAYPDVVVTSLLEKIRKHPFRNWDGREFNKTKQWNKLYVFDTFFKQWDYILFVDAGIRVFHPIEPFFLQFKKNSLIALNDGHPDFTKKFDCQIEMSNTEVVEKLKKIYDIHSDYFLNCLFLFSTDLIHENTLQDLLNLMNEYPICKTNEMAIMNIYFAKNWVPLNIYLRKNMLFDWSERDGRTYKDYIALKYPTTI